MLVALLNTWFALVVRVWVERLCLFRGLARSRTSGNVGRDEDRCRSAVRTGMSGCCKRLLNNSVCFTCLDSRHRLGECLLDCPSRDSVAKRSANRTVRNARLRCIERQLLQDPPNQLTCISLTNFRSPGAGHLSTDCSRQRSLATNRMPNDVVSCTSGREVRSRLDV